MERKEFNNIEEAIEALLAIPNIDDIGTDKIKEIDTSAATKRNWRIRRNYPNVS